MTEPLDPAGRRAAVGLPRRRRHRRGARGRGRRGSSDRPEARAEYESLAAVKAALGGLGEVEPPFGFYDRMLRQGTPTPEVTSAADRARRRPRGRWLAAGGADRRRGGRLRGRGRGHRRPSRPPVDEVAAGDRRGVSPSGPAASRRWPWPRTPTRCGGTSCPTALRGTEGDAETWIDLTTEDPEVRVGGVRGRRGGHRRRRGRRCRRADRQPAEHWPRTRPPTRASSTACRTSPRRSAPAETPNR